MPLIFEMRELSHKRGTLTNHQLRHSAYRYSAHAHLMYNGELSL